MNYMITDHDGVIKSWGESTSISLIRIEDNEVLFQLNDMEYALISACRGNLSRAKLYIGNIQQKINNFFESCGEN